MRVVGVLSVVSDGPVNIPEHSPSGSHRKSASFYYFDNNDSCLLCADEYVLCARECVVAPARSYFLQPLNSERQK